MSLKFVDQFTMKIYKLIADITPIKKHIKRIYLTAKQDGIKPFILINITRIEDLTGLIQEIYELDFEISIFTGPESVINAVEIADKIKEKLNLTKKSFDNFEIASMKNTRLTHEQGRDLTTSKLTLNYSALIKQGIKA